MMKVEVICRDTIKPSSPTPLHLRNFSLSLLDQLSPPVYVPVILFYTVDQDDQIDNAKISDRLKKSLSEALTHFYPISGRIKDNLLIDCNDEGVEYFEARVDVELSEVLRCPEADMLLRILPCDLYSSGAQLAVQVNVFDCGGIAISVCVQHKIADAAALSTFINAWAAAAANGTKEILYPTFDSASLFPPSEVSSFTSVTEGTVEKVVAKRFVFEASKISALQTKAAGNNSSAKHPTRVEAVSALIWRCAMAVARAKSRSPKQFVVNHSVNLRGRMIPQLPEHSFGNLVTLASAASTAENGFELHYLVGQLRDAISKINDDYIRKSLAGEGFSMMLEFYREKYELCSKGEMEVYTFTSWCRFPLYEADFGWGKPVWVTIASQPFKNVVTFMDTRSGDGIEAWVNLVEEDMALFEQDQELLEFVSSTHCTSKIQ